MSNRVVAWYRSQHPTDQRSDDEITLDVAAESPDTFQQYDDAMADFKRINLDLRKSMETPMDTAKAFVRGAARNVIPAVATAAGAIGAGALATPETVGIGTIPAAIAGGAAAGAAARKLQDLVFGKDEDQAAEDLQLHPIATRAGEFLGQAPSLLGAGGAGKALTESLIKRGLSEAAVKELGNAGGALADTLLNQGLKQEVALRLGKLAQSSAAGAIMSGSSAAQAKVEGQDVSILGETLKGAVTMGPVAFVPHATSVLGALGWKAPTDAAVLSVSNALYDSIVRGKSFNPKEVAESAGLDIPGFMLVNGLTAALHLPFIPVRKNGKATPKVEVSHEQPDAADQDEHVQLMQVHLASVADALGEQKEYRAWREAQLAKQPEIKPAEETPPPPEPSPPAPVPAAATGVDATANFATDEERGLVDELVTKLSQRERGPQMDALSAQVGSLLRASPALQRYYDAKVAETPPVTISAPAATPAPPAASSKEETPLEKRKREQSRLDGVWAGRSGTGDYVRTSLGFDAEVLSISAAGPNNLLVRTAEGSVLPQHTSGLRNLIPGIEADDAAIANFKKRQLRSTDGQGTAGAGTKLIPSVVEQPAPPPAGPMSLGEPNPLADNHEPDYLPTTSAIELAKKLDRKALEREAKRGEATFADNELAQAQSMERAARKIILKDQIKRGVVKPEPGNRLYEEAVAEVKNPELARKPVETVKPTADGSDIVADLNLSIDEGRGQITKQQQKVATVEEGFNVIKTKGKPEVGKAVEMYAGFPRKAIRGVVTAVEGETVTLKTFDGEERTLPWKESSRLISGRTTGTERAGETITGVGQKSAEFYVENPTADELYDDALKTGTTSPKQGVFLSPDGRTYVRATVYTNASKGERQVRYVSMPEGDKTKARRLDVLLNEGWQVVAALKVKPTKGFAASYSPAAWEAVKPQLRGLVTAARDTAAAMEQHLEQAKDYGRVPAEAGHGEEAPAGKGGPQLREEEAAPEATGGGTVGPVLNVEFEPEESMTLAGALQGKEIKRSEDIVHALAGDPKALGVARRVIEHLISEGVEGLTAARMLADKLYEIYSSRREASQAELAKSIRTSGSEPPVKADRPASADAGAGSGSPEAGGGGQGTEARNDAGPKAGDEGTRHARRRDLNPDELNAELRNDKGEIIQGSGWIAPDGEFIPADETPAVRMAGLEMGGHEKAALDWMETRKPEWRAELAQDSDEAGDLDSEAVNRFMLKHGFVRVASGGYDHIFIEGQPNRTQLQLARDSAISRGASLIHDLPQGRSRTIYEPESHRYARERLASSATDSTENRQRFNAVRSALAAAGVSVRLLGTRIGNIAEEFGRYDVLRGKDGRIARLITLGLADPTHPSRGSFGDLIEEAFHAVFDNEPTARKLQAERAIRAVTDDLLGISGLKLSEEYSAEQAGKVLQEERLAAVIRQRLVEQGFNPEESHGFAQAVVRLVKDVFHRLTMAIQEGYNGRVSAETAAAYFENRVKSILSGDTQYSLIDFLGGPKLNEYDRLDRHEQATTADWGMTLNAADNARRHSEMRVVTNPREPVTKDLDSTELKKPWVAAANFAQGLMDDAFKVYERLGFNTTKKLSAEDFGRSGSMLRLPLKIGEVEHYKEGEIPADRVTETNQQLIAVGQKEINPGLRIEDVSPTMQPRAAAAAHRELKVMQVEMSVRRRTVEVDNIERRATMDRNNTNLYTAIKKYADLDAVLAVAKPELKALIEDFKKTTKTIGEEGRKLGTLEQVLKALGENVGQKNATQWKAALDTFSKELGTTTGGQKFTDLLEKVSTLDIDWNSAKPADIRDTLLLVATKDEILKPLADGSDKGKALLAATIAFAKSNANVMDLLALRREKAVEQKQAANEALDKALENHTDAIKQARELLTRRGLVKLETDAAGNVVNVTMTGVGKRVVRVLDRIEKLKEQNQATLTDLQREAEFADWHDAFAPVLQARLIELERQIGARYVDFQVVEGAEIPFVPNEKATLAQVMANTRKLTLTEAGTKGLREDMRGLRDWLDKIPEDQRGADWQDLDAVYQKVTKADIFRGSDSIRQNFILRTLAPLPDRFRLIGNPVTRLLASRLFEMGASLHALTAPTESLGRTFEAAEVKLMRATGSTWFGSIFRTGSQDLVRARFWQPAMGWLEKHQDLLASQPNEKAAEDLGVREVVAFISKDPRTADLLARNGAKERLADYVRIAARNWAWVAKNGETLGNKVLDESGNFKVLRKAIGQTPYTIPRSFSALAETIVNVMGKLPWSDFKSKLLNENKLAAEYTADPEAMRARLAGYTNADVWNTFAKVLVEREGRSTFHAPEGVDGLLRFASRENTLKAYELAKGDFVRFAEELYNLEDGKTDPAAYIGKTLAQWQLSYDLLEVNRAEADAYARSNMPQIGPRRYLADARKSEELPAPLLDYLAPDTFTLLQVSKGQVYQAHLGRNLEAWHNNVNTAKKQQGSLAADYARLEQFFRQDRGLKGHRLVSAMKAEVTGGWKNVPGVSELGRTATYTQLEQAGRNLQSIDSASKQFDDVMTLNRERPPEFRAWMGLLRTMAGATVSGPATAFTDNIASVQQIFRKMGFSWDTVKIVLDYKKTEMALSGNSMLQTIGLTFGNMGQHVTLANELGFFDDAATLSIKDRTLASMLELQHYKGLEKVPAAISQVVRMFMSTGIGKRPKTGEPIYPMFKPQSPFLMGAQETTLAGRIIFWNLYENLIGGAMRHFTANPLDQHNADFKFSQRDLSQMGFKSNSRMWEFLNSRLADYGVGGLESVARDAMARRAADPKAGVLTKEAMIKLSALVGNEITLDSGLATRAPFLMDNPLGNAMNPIAGWALGAAYDFTLGTTRGPTGTGGVRATVAATYDKLRGRATPEQLHTLQGTRTALAATLFGVLPAALGYALVRDLYDEYVMKRKGNVRDLTTIKDPKDAFLTMLDNASRVGTMGIFGELLNQQLNYDSARPVTLDSRIFMVASIKAFNQSLQNWAMQGGNADWATVGRPLISSLGGSGYLQYADSINGLLGADNTEARISQRTSVNNYLRVAGRELGLDVRKSQPGGSPSMPNEMKPYIGQMVMSALANDASGFAEALRLAKAAAKDMGNADPTDTVKRSFAAYNPLRAVFKTEPSPAQVQQLIASLSDRGAETVRDSIRLFNHYGEQLGIPANVGKADSNKPGLLPTLNLLPKPTLNDVRRQAASYGLGF